MADSSLPRPKYTIWQAINACLALSVRAIEEVRALAARPPKEGRPGKDGMGFDDLTIELAEDGRTVVFRLMQGERIKETRIKFDMMLDRGIYRDSTSYSKGDFVTYGGCGWVAQGDTQDKPGTGTKGWRLFAQKGRDGKDGVMRPPPGPVKIG